MSNTEQLDSNTGEKAIGVTLMNKIINNLLTTIGDKKDISPDVTTTLTIYSGIWANGTDVSLDPYTYTTSSITGVTNTSHIDVKLSDALTDREYKSQLSVFENAKIHRITPNPDGTIVLKCFGTKPTIDIKLDVFVQ